MRSTFLFGVFGLLMLAAACASLTDYDAIYPWRSGDYKKIQLSDWKRISLDTSRCGDYNYTFSVSSSDLEKNRYYLRFRMPAVLPKLYINQKDISHWKSSLTPELTPHLVPGSNTLSFAMSDSLAWNACVSNAELLIAPKVSFGRQDGAFSLKTERAGADYATFKSTAWVTNGSDTDRAVLVKGELIAPDGRIVSTARKYLEVVPDSTKPLGYATPVMLDFNTFYHPKLWSPQAPILYRYKLSLLAENDKLLDRMEGDFGIRWFSFTPAGFSLNGVPSELRGIALWPNPDPELALRDIQDVKRLGANFVYFTDNPTEYQVMLCDRLGLLCALGNSAEINTDPRSEGYLPGGEHAERISPMLFGVGFERHNLMNDSELKTATVAANRRGRHEQIPLVGIYSSAELAKVSNVIIVHSHVSKTPTINCLSALKTAGVITPTLNWITFNTTRDSDAALRLEKALEESSKLPKWVNGIVAGTYRAGDIGLVDCEGKPTDAYYLLASRWSAEPMAHIYTNPRPDEKEKNVWHFRIFSNLPQAELIVNGVSLGTAQTPFGEWRAELKPGKNKIRLEAVDPVGELSASDTFTFNVE